MNIRRGLQRISALFWGFVATIGVIMSIAIASDFFKTGNGQDSRSCADRRCLGPSVGVRRA